jgi:HEAT repeat protein
MSLAQEIPGPAATKALADLMPKLAPPMQASLVGVLGRRGDAVAKPAVLAAVKSADDGVRIAAFGALATLGDASDVMLLTKTAAAAPGPEADAARASLAALRGADINKAMLGTMATPDAKVRAELLRALAARRAADAAPAMVKALGDADAPVRMEASKALEVVGDDKSAPQLIAYVVKTQADDENQAAEKALLAICGRAAGKDACLQAVMAALPESKMPARGSLLRALGRLGGDKALAAVRTAVADADPKIKEAAVRALSDWPDTAAAPDLLVIAKTDTKGTLPVLALRGYVRLAGLPEQAPAQKILMCREALAVAKRPEEKRAVLAVLGEVNTAESLKMISPMLDDGTVKEEAAQASTKVAKALGNNLPPETKEMMERVLSFTKNKNAQKDAAEVLKKVRPPKK